ncbi:MAG: GxxExxY protein [Planctomycetia bacterium]|nr:GxxExxY protein [Planctomycetia bacterium]
MAEGNSELIFKQECFEIVGACFDVYKGMGSGFLEAVYQECLGIEFANRRIPFVPTPELRLSYPGRLLNQTYFPDFLCYEQIIVELKAVTGLANEHRAQAINYLRATNLQLAILVNFGHQPKLEYERLVLTKKSDSQ